MAINIILFTELPVLPAHGALLLYLLSLKPLLDTVEVEAVTTLTRHWVGGCDIISCLYTRRNGERVSRDSAHRPHPPSAQSSPGNLQSGAASLERQSTYPALRLVVGCDPLPHCHRRPLLEDDLELWLWSWSRGSRAGPGGGH